MRNCTNINIILDRSGSMGNIRNDTIGSINSFIEDQRKISGECELSLYQFDDQYEIVYQNINIHSAPLLTVESFVPRGTTALLDAIGQTIEEKGRYFAGLPTTNRPNKVLFVIMTDGAENASRRFSNHQITQMISLQTKQYNWDFIFLGANQDAIASASTLGIAPSKALNFNSNSQSLRGSSQVLSSYTQSIRSGDADDIQLCNFSAEDRLKANV